jgi:hypothetical protein
MSSLPPQQLDDSTISYARPVGGVTTMPVRPTWLIVPHVLALALIFVPFANDSPLQVLTRFVQGFRRGGPPFLFWDAMVTGPFLLALPLAVWTVRLMFPPPPSRGERGAAWAVVCAMLAPLLLVMGFVLTRFPQFVIALTGTVVVLIVGAAYVASLRRLAWSYVPALAAMSFAYLANTVLVVLIVLGRGPVGGPLAGAIFILLEAIALLILWLRWRREVPMV